MVYGGTIRPGTFDGKPVDVVSAFQRYGELLAGTHRRDRSRRHRARRLPRRRRLRRHVHREHDGDRDRGARHEPARQLVDARRPRPRRSPSAAPPAPRCAGCSSSISSRRDIMTRAAFENAMAVVVAIGGSTNAVLHLIAMARAVDVDALDRRLPGHQRPRAAARRLQAPRSLRDGGPAPVGGTPAVLRLLLDRGLLHGDCITVTGRTLAENLADAPGLDARARR